MNGTIKLVAPLVAALAIAACSSGNSSNVPAAGSQTVGSPSSRIPQWQARHLARATCPQVVGKPSCFALQIIKNGAPPPCSPTSTCGFTATQLEAAYDLTPSLGLGSGTKVAVIEAGDLSSAATDLATYRSEYGLGTASFFKYNENGQQSNYPPSCEDYGWCVETALDIEMVSASCPKCTIYLMEAKNNSTDGISDFETAEAEAVTLGATIVSNSWGCYGSWDCGDTNFGSYFSSPGIAYLASSGDGAYNQFGGPGALASVVAVGGTQLEKSGTTFTETVWNDASAGCASPSEVGSPGVPKPAWQHDPDCTYRTDADIAAQAGVSPGVAVYTSLYGGWFGVGGTSVASPLLAGVVALKGNAANMQSGKRFWEMHDGKVARRLHYISSGNDGSCGGEYLCTAGTNQFETYSGPAGWGTPKGIKAF